MGRAVVGWSRAKGVGRCVWCVVFFFVFFCPGKERKKHRKFRGGGGEAMPSEGTREVAVFLLFLLFSTFLGGGFYSIFLCRNFCKIYHIRLIG